MTSFIELPRLTGRGLLAPPMYVNVDDIITFTREHTGETRVTLRSYGSDGHGVVMTYVPYVALCDVLGMLAEHPGVRSWSPESLDEWGTPIAARLAEEYRRSRGHGA